MGNRKILLLAAAIIVGALAGFALLNYVQDVEETAVEGTRTVPVFTVVDTIEQGSSVAAAQVRGLIQEDQIEQTFRPDGAISDLAQLDGLLATTDITAGQILVASQFAAPVEAVETFADQIGPDFAAISLTVPRANAVNGFLSPGDFVDVIVISGAPVQVGDLDAFDTSLEQSPLERVARTLYRGVRIESVGNETLADIAELETAPDDLQAAGENLRLTVAVPSEAIQYLLSVDPNNIVLALLPDGWTPESQENVVTPAILRNEPLPGEVDNAITPYGPGGLVLEDINDIPGAESPEDDAAPVEEPVIEEDEPEDLVEVEPVDEEFDPLLDDGPADEADDLDEEDDFTDEG